MQQALLESGDSSPNLHLKKGNELLSTPDFNDITTRDKLGIRDGLLAGLDSISDNFSPQHIAQALRIFLLRNKELHRLLEVSNKEEGLSYNPFALFIRCTLGAGSLPNPENPDWLNTIRAIGLFLCCCGCGYCALDCAEQATSHPSDSTATKIIKGALPLAISGSVLGLGGYFVGNFFKKSRPSDAGGWAMWTFLALLTYIIINVIIIQSTKESPEKSYKSCQELLEHGETLFNELSSRMLLLAPPQQAEELMKEVEDAISGYFSTSLVSGWGRRSHKEQKILFAKAVVIAWAGERLANEDQSVVNEQMGLVLQKFGFFPPPVIAMDRRQNLLTHTSNPYSNQHAVTK